MRSNDRTIGGLYPSAVLLVFLDGVGLGPETPENPLAALNLPSLERLTGGRRWTATAEAFCKPTHVFRPIEATLGVAGLPQSGTGQATLFTGINCAALAGRHFGPYPHSLTRPALASHNIFRQVREVWPEHPDPVAFANAYPPAFFQSVRKRDRWTVTTRACLDAGVPVRDHLALAAGDAIAADLTGSGWKTFLGMDVDLISEEDAGRRLVAITRRHVFTLFEYYLTDKAGHSRSGEQAEHTLLALERFFTGILAHLPPDILLIVTSDHGNLEDLSTRSHTTNPVPLIAFGPGAAQFCNVADLTGVTPAIVSLLTSPPK